MSDEDLLIGGKKEQSPQAQGSSGIQVPMDFVNVSFFGVFKDSERLNPDLGEDEYVEQVFKTQVPRHEPPENVAQFLWLKLFQQAAIRTVGTAGEINFYPLDRFKRFTAKVGTVVGVTV
jgi:hypothetical protein